MTNEQKEAMDAIYPGKPPPIDLTEIKTRDKKPEKSTKLTNLGKKREEKPMEMRTFGKILWSIFAVAGILAVGYYGLLLFRPGTFGADPLEDLEAEKAGRIRKIMAYCVRGTGDGNTCNLWIQSYDQLVTGKSEDVALFEHESHDRIAEVKHRRGLEAEAEAAEVPGKSGKKGL